MSRFGRPDDRTKHQYYEDRLSAYLDGELAPQEQDAVRRHLTTCKACQWDLDTLQATAQWTSELPIVPLPRVFTIPATTQPARAVWRRWSFVPVLQGATALVALLLFFAVAGDLLLSGFGGGRAPEPMLMQEQASVIVEATQVVELVTEAEAPVAPPAAEVAVERATVETAEMEKADAEKVVVETVEVEKEVVAAAPSPMPLTAPAAEPASGETRATAPKEDAARVATSVSEEGLVGEAAQEPQAEEAPAELEAADATAGGGPTPTVLAPAPGMPEWQEAAPAQRWHEPGVNWLRVLEVALTVTFLLLVAATIFATIQRRRAR
jgi:anti-sigma factor RsiW